ncbi:hypothetical protein [Hydrogenophaga sp.]|uniref:hypothetical protein n=1 Tax=Hydrogenophaga sp. TaxID=1904254 RepID=UPI0019C66866|nr:hypothetical protein [Hydrogenophaga sp.]MBD3893829.1 hypothetical protein [Hydrogenophaga sp.]
MKIAVWLVFFLLAVLWTGLVAISVQATEWLLTAADGAQVGDAVTQAAQWPLPAWLAFWVDPAWVQALQESWLGMVQWLEQVLPGAAGLMGWIAPLMWIGWGLVMLVLLLLALLAHGLIGRMKKPRSLGRA